MEQMDGEENGMEGNKEKVEEKRICMIEKKWMLKKGKKEK